MSEGKKPTLVEELDTAAAIECYGENRSELADTDCTTVIDNPDKQCREFRENGKLRCFMTRQAIDMGRYPNEKKWGSYPSS